MTPRNEASFFFPNVPLLSASVVVCCAKRDDDELILFWRSADEFCRRFRLNPLYTLLVKAPDKNKERDPEGRRIPTQQQLDALAFALVQELSAAQPASTPSKMPKSADPRLMGLFPVLFELYEFYALGAGKPHPEWQADLGAEICNSRHIFW